VLEWLYILAQNLSNAGDACNFSVYCGKEGRLGDLPAVHPILFTHLAEFPGLFAKALGFSVGFLAGCHHLQHCESILEHCVSARRVSIYAVLKGALKYSQVQDMIDGHPIHNKDPNIMVIINPILNHWMTSPVFNGY